MLFFERRFLFLKYFLGHKALVLFPAAYTINVIRKFLYANKKKIRNSFFFGIVVR